MTHDTLCLTLALAIALSVRLSTAQTTHPATQPSADALIAEYEALRPPPLEAEKLGDREYTQKRQLEQKQVLARRAELAWTFFERFPDHPRAGAMLMDRWQSQGREDPQRTLGEVQQVIDRAPPVPARADALYVKAAMNLMGMAGGTRDTGKAVIEEFVAAYPTDERSPQLLRGIAQTSKDPEEKKAIEERIAREFPDSFPARVAKAEGRRASAVGKPFELTFTDAISGKKVSVADMKGKVVVIDFWATWCGPCVAEMPALKKLYAEHHDKGLEIIGVSLDRPEREGGLKELKAFVEKNQIPWHQYYQGKGWASEFSSGWGITGIPAVFVVGPDGNLFSTNARGALEQIVPQLLAKSATPRE